MNVRSLPGKRRTIWWLLHFTELTTGKIFWKGTTRKRKNIEKQTQWLKVLSLRHLDCMNKVNNVKPAVIWIYAFTLRLKFHFHKPVVFGLHRKRWKWNGIALLKFQLSRFFLPFSNSIWPCTEIDGWICWRGDSEGNIITCELVRGYTSDSRN